jgi:hypothetical protein
MTNYVTILSSIYRLNICPLHMLVMRNTLQTILLAALMFAAFEGPQASSSWTVRLHTAQKFGSYLALNKLSVLQRPTGWVRLGKNRCLV